MMFSVTAQIEYEHKIGKDTWGGSMGVPGFYVEAINEGNAIIVAMQILGMLRPGEQTVHVCAVEIGETAP